ncbi:MAG: hypothetical protein PSV35_01720 [bacterium]|nr:hypothetical protein [bacterium]
MLENDISIEDANELYNKGMEPIEKGLPSLYPNIIYDDKSPWSVLLDCWKDAALAGYTQAQYRYKLYLSTAAQLSNYYNERLKNEVDLIQSLTETLLQKLEANTLLEYAGYYFRGNKELGIPQDLKQRITYIKKNCH